MGWAFQPLPLAAPTGGPVIYSETGGAAFGSVASGADSHTPGAGPSFTLLDDFDRASIGGNWSVYYPGDGSIATVGSSQATSDNSSYGDAVWTPSTYTDTGAAVTVDALGGGGMVAVRAQSPNTSGLDSYELGWLSSGALELQRVNDGSYTLLSTLGGATISAGDAIGLIATGTGATVRVTAYVNDGGGWVSIGYVDDTATGRITSAGYLALGFYNNTGRGNNFGSLDASGGTVYTESGTGTSGWAASATDAGVGVDAGAGVCQGAAGGVDAGVGVDTGVGVGAWVASGDAFRVFSESGAATLQGAAGGVDAGVSTDTGAGVGAWVVGAADAVVWVDAGADVFEGSASGAEAYTPGGGTVYTESGAALMLAAASGADVYVATDTGAGAGAWVASGGGSFVGADAGGAAVTMVAAGADRVVAFDAGAGVFTMVASGDEFTPAVGHVKPVHVRGGDVTAAESTSRTRGGGVVVAQSTPRTRGGGVKTT